MSNVSSDMEPPKRGFGRRGPEVSWGPLSAVIVTVLVFLGAQIAAAIILAGFLGGDNPEWLDDISGQFYFVLLSDSLILLALWAFLRRRRAGPRQLGLGRRPVWRDIGLAVLGYLAYFGLLIAALSIAGGLTDIDLDQKQELGFENLLSSSDKIMALLSLVILPPIVEEVVFRGFVFGGLRKKLNFWWATIFTSLLFAGPHLLASSEGLLWVAGIDTLVLSFVLCYLRETTGALWAPIIVHAIKNSVAFVFLLVGAVMIY
jgi:membrane protease YdiL (CAAX protease family)